MSLEAPPPARHIRSTAIDQHAASVMLDTYLRNSESHPHLHPDAIITPSGVTASSIGGSHGGVVMHNLRRVAAGLRGDYLEPEATPEPEEQGPDAQETRTHWQDAGTAALQEDGLAVGNMWERTNVVVQDDEVLETGRTNGDVNEGANKRKQEDVVMTKEQRKKAKKERDQKRKRDIEQQRAIKTD